MQEQTYKYVLYPGNNHVMIQQALINRNVWQQLPNQKIMCANFIWRNLNFPQQIYLDFDQIQKYDRNRLILLNHFEHNHLITTKSGLFKSLKYYYSHQLYADKCHIFQTIPTTFVVQAHKQTTEWKDFKERYQQLQQKNYIKEKIPQKHCKQNVWFIKPQSQNQGRGIILNNNFKQLQAWINSKPVNTNWVIQKCIQKPLLYHGRKFDIRVWSLVTSQYEIYYYKIPYMRTSSQKYNPTDFASDIHLTNNYQQKHKQEYSKYQKGNTIPLTMLLNYLKQTSTQKSQVQHVYQQIIQRMKDLILDVSLSVKKLFNRNVRKKQFQLFGFDFLVDQDYRVWLLQVNNNPYLGTPNDFARQLVPKMINQMFEIILDPLFPPKDYQPVLQKNFELIHRQVSLFRISNVRGISSQGRKKSLYPTQGGGVSVSKKHRRNSQAISTTQNSILVNNRNKYYTPTQTLKNLLQTYYFNDYQPFLTPVNLILTSSKLTQKQSLQINQKTLKLITQTRIVGILLQNKFIQISKTILNSDKYEQQLKILLINGYYNAIRSSKSRILLIKNLVPTIINLIIKNITPNQNINLQLISIIIKFIIKLGGIIQRKIFIPGQTRDAQYVRQMFIKSNCLRIIMFFKQQYHQICQEEIKDFLDNFNQKDWDLYYSVIKNPQNLKNSDSPLNLSLKLQINVDIFEEKQRLSTSLKDILENKSQRVNRIGGFPKIKK